MPALKKVKPSSFPATVGKSRYTFSGLRVNKLASALDDPDQLSKAIGYGRVSHDRMVSVYMISSEDGEGRICIAAGAASKNSTCCCSCPSSSGGCKPVSAAISAGGVSCTAVVGVGCYKAKIKDVH
jgi:hypothetical protein